LVAHTTAPHGSTSSAPSTRSREATSSAPPRAEYARIAAPHRRRLNDGDLLAQTPRLDWAKLLRRTFACDVLVCPRCTGRVRVLAAIHDPGEARRFLNALDQRSLPRPPPPRRSLEDDEPWLDPAVGVDVVSDADAGSDADEATTPAHDHTLDEHEAAPPSSRQEAPPPDD